MPNTAPLQPLASQDLRAPPDDGADAMPGYSPSALVAGIGQLVSLPDVALRLNALIDSGTASHADMAEVVSSDPALVARLLRIVNSAAYGLPARVDTVTRAITLVGAEELRALVLATMAAQAFRHIPFDLVDMDTFWQHSIYTALAARAVAAEVRPAHRERLFLAGLLHDVGELVLYHQLPEVSRRILEAMQHGGTRETEEFSALGFTHADVGAELLRSWQLPGTLVEPVQFHHDWQSRPEGAPDADIVALANLVAKSMEPGVKSVRRTPVVIDETLWARTGWVSDRQAAIVAAIDAGWYEVMKIIVPGANPVF